MRRWEESEKRREGKRRRKKIKEEKVWEERRSRCEKVGKSRNTMFFQWFVVPEGRKVGSLKRRVRSHLARWEMKSCTPLWREAHFQVKMYKTHQPRTTFGSWHVEKLHAVVARSTFPSQNAQNTPTSGHFWKLRCRKSARRMWWRSTFPSQNVQSTPTSDHFWKLTCRKSARRCGAKHISKSKVHKNEGYGTLLDVQTSFCVAGAGAYAPCQKWGNVRVLYQFQRQSPLHYTPLHYTTLHSTTIHYATLQSHYTTLTLHYNYNYNCNSNYNYTNYTNYIRVHYTTLH